MWHDMAIIILCSWSSSPKHRHDLHHRSIVMIFITEATSWFPSSPAWHLDLHRSVVVVSPKLLPRLSLPLSDKVKQLHGDCISYNKATTIRLLPVADNITKHDHLIQQIISHHVLTISHHKHTLQKQVRRPLLCCCKFYVAATGLEEPILTYAKPQRGVVIAFWSFEKNPLHWNRFN